MVWFRVDDGWHKHRKRIRAGLDMEGMAAQGLWTAAGSWAAEARTDGWVPADVVACLAPASGQQLALRLERAHLWVRAIRDGKEGWQSQDFGDLWSIDRGEHRAKIHPSIRALVYERDEYRCVECASTEDLTLDHIHPWSLGGSDSPANLRTLCRPCNSSKGARVP